MPENLTVYPYPHHSFLLSFPSPFFPTLLHSFIRLFFLSSFLSPLSSSHLKYLKSQLSFLILTDIWCYTFSAKISFFLFILTLTSMTWLFVGEIFVHYAICLGIVLCLKLDRYHPTTLFSHLVLSSYILSYVLYCTAVHTTIQCSAPSESILLLHVMSRLVHSLLLYRAITYFAS